MLSAGGLRCIVGGTHIASFSTWLERLESTGNCAWLAVELHGRQTSADGALATLCRLAAVGATELRVESLFTARLDSSQLLQVVQALGAGTPCRLRTLCIDLPTSALPALNLITTLQRLESSSAWDDDPCQWKPNLPQLTALVVGAQELRLSLDSVPALQQLVLKCEEYI